VSRRRASRGRSICFRRPSEAAVDGDRSSVSCAGVEQTQRHVGQLVTTTTFVFLFCHAVGGTTHFVLLRRPSIRVTPAAMALVRTRTAISAFVPLPKSPRLHSGLVHGPTDGPPGPLAAVRAMDAALRQSRWISSSRFRRGVGAGDSAGLPTGRMTNGRWPSGKRRAATAFASSKAPTQTVARPSAVAASWA